MYFRLFHSKVLLNDSLNRRLFHGIRPAGPQNLTTTSKHFSTITKSMGMRGGFFLHSFPIKNNNYWHHISKKANIFNAVVLRTTPISSHNHQKHLQNAYSGFAGRGLVSPYERGHYHTSGKRKRKVNTLAFLSDKTAVFSTTHSPSAAWNLDCNSKTKLKSSSKKGI